MLLSSSQNQLWPQPEIFHDVVLTSFWRGYLWVTRAIGAYRDTRPCTVVWLRYLLINIRIGRDPAHSETAPHDTTTMPRVSG